MRWYRVAAIRSFGFSLEECDQIVQATGVADAFEKVRSLGWWPTSIINSAWAQSDV